VRERKREREPSNGNGGMRGLGVIKPGRKKMTREKEREREKKRLRESLGSIWNCNGESPECVEV
jgi:hypothetical protein